MPLLMSYRSCSLDAAHASCLGHAATAALVQPPFALMLWFCFAQLFQRRFTKTAAYNSAKSGPGVLCYQGTTDEQIWRMYMNAMRRPLRWRQEFREQMMQLLPPMAPSWTQPKAAPVTE
jgi:hypothetical protein